jgi:hypothetical protein
MAGRLQRRSQLRRETGMTHVLRGQPEKKSK